MNPISRRWKHRALPWTHIIHAYMACRDSVDDIANRFNVAKTLLVKHFGFTGLSRQRDKQTVAQAYEHLLQDELLTIHNRLEASPTDKSQEHLLRRVETWCRLAETGRRIHGLDRDPESAQHRPLGTLVQEVKVTSSRPSKRARALPGPKPGEQVTDLEPIEPASPPDTKAAGS